MGLSIRLRRARAIVVPERTSAALRFLGWRRLLIHFRHGAGDRAPASEKRLSAFDLIVVPGEKDVKRATDVQGVDPARLRTCGYVKLDYREMTNREPRPRMFDNERPVVVYNPRFDPSISSWPTARQIIASFTAQARYNLIVAPHIRLSENMTRREFQEWEQLAVPGRIIIDLRSPRLLDMTYTRAADVYLGDVSSQLYEYLTTPRPVAFVNAHGVDWHDDQRYVGWHLGEVGDADSALNAIDRSVINHGSMLQLQAAAVDQAFGTYRGASARGARIVADAIGVPTIRSAERDRHRAVGRG